MSEDPIVTCSVCGRRDFQSRMTWIGYFKWAHFWHASGGQR
jgi:hypothetical protein